MSTLPVRFGTESALRQATELVRKGTPVGVALKAVGVDVTEAMEAQLAVSLQHLLADGVAADVVKAELLRLVLQDNDPRLKLDAIREAKTVFPVGGQQPVLERITVERLAEIEKKAEE